MKRRTVLPAVLALLLCGCRQLTPPAEQTSPADTAVTEAETTLTEPETTAQTESTPAPPPTAADIAAMPAGTVLDEAILRDLPADALFTAEPLPDAVFARISGVSYIENPDITPDELRYLRLLHITPAGETKTGEMIANYSIADDLVEIFRALYDARYPIEQIQLIEAYGGDDDASMADNNSSCFNYRTVPDKGTLSRHALGLAIDVNPLYNPYITDTGVIMPESAAPYADRGGDFPMKITKDDLCCQLFREHGFHWGGFWSNSPDYQHFEMRIPQE